MRAASAAQLKKMSSMLVTDEVALPPPLERLEMP